MQHKISRSQNKNQEIFARTRAAPCGVFQEGNLMNIIDSVIDTSTIRLREQTEEADESRKETQAIYFQRHVCWFPQ